MSTPTDTATAGDRLLAKARALVDAVSFDDCGALIAGQFMGGSGGLLSRATIKAADELRKELERVRP